MPADEKAHRRETTLISDVELRYRVQTALTWNRSLPPGGVQAHVEAGWLTLSGEVRWHYQRQDAFNCVRHLPGIVGVHNFIRLLPPQSGRQRRGAAP